MDSPASHSRSRLCRLLVWLALIAALALVTGVRLRLLQIPLERDEGEYAYAGQLLLDGIPPYRLAYSMKLPGVSLSYAAMMAVFGQTLSGVHLGLLLVHLGSLVLLFLLARRFFSLPASAIAVISVACVALSPAVFGLAAHATHFVILPALGGLLILTRRPANSRFLDCATAGLLCGLAFLMKQPGLAFGLFGFLYIFALECRARPFRWKSGIGRLSLFFAGCAIPYAALCIWLERAGVFSSFWFWTVTYSRKYGEAVSPRAGLTHAMDGFAALFRAAPLLSVLVFLGLILCMIPAAPVRSRSFILGFSFFSLLAVCPGLYFRPHYFILLLPAAGLLAAQGVDCAGHWLQSRSAALRSLPFLAALAACAQGLYLDRAVFFSLSPLDACRAIYGDNPFPESVDIGRYIGQHTSREQTLAVIGSEPQIYFYAHRHSATGYIYAYPLMEQQPYAHQMQEEMIAEVERARPACVVYVSFPPSWLGRSESDPLIFRWFDQYRRSLAVEGIIEMFGAGRIEEYWGPSAADTPMRSHYFLLLMKAAK